MTSPAQSGQIFVGDLSASLESLAADAVDLQRQINVLRHGYTQIADKVHDLEDAIGTTPPTTPTDPVDPPTEPGTRRFGCNVGYKEDDVWSPESNYTDPRYVEYLKPVAKCLRFEWWRSNDEVGFGTLTQERKDRIDRYIDLCNACKSDIHLVFFIHDTEEDIKWIVERVKTRLWAGAVRYYEVPNEMWNGGSWKDDSGNYHTTGTAVFREIARLCGQPDFWTDGNTAFFSATANIASQQIVWFKKYDPDCTTVLGCLTANPWWMENVEKYMTVKPDAHGLTFYFGAGLGDNPPANATVDDIIAAARSKLFNEITRIESHAQKSRAMGRRIVGYEGGPHFTIQPWMHDSHKVTWQNMNEANRRENIVVLCNSVAVAAEDNGFEQLNWYNYMSVYDKWGSWGLGESLNSIRDNPKYRYAAGVE